MYISDVFRRVIYLLKAQPAETQSGHRNAALLSIQFNVGFTEVVPIVGVERGEGAYIYLTATL